MIRVQIEGFAIILGGPGPPLRVLNQSQEIIHLRGNAIRFEMTFAQFGGLAQLTGIRQATRRLQELGGARIAGVRRVRGWFFDGVFPLLKRSRFPHGARKEMLAPELSPA